MTIYQTADLDGALLDAAVAKAEGYELDSDGDNMTLRENCGRPSAWHPSTDWWHGGPIIEREQISVWRYAESTRIEGDWFAGSRGGLAGWDTGDVIPHGTEAEGPTALIAAMRAYVASKFGATVDLP